VTLKTDVGPDGLGQLVSEVTPLIFIVQAANPAPFVGDAPPEGPGIVAVKMIDPPNKALPEFALTEGVDEYLDTVVDELVFKETLK